MTTSLDNFPTIGPALALTTAALWAISPMLMASAGRRVGSFPVVLLRGLLASTLLSTAVGVMSIVGSAPAFPTGNQMFWLWVSGVVGMGVGDVLVYEAFVTLGPRRTTQVLVLAPPVTVLVGWTFLGEAMNGQMLAGIAIILLATFYAVLAGQRRGPVASTPAAEQDSIAGGESGDVEVLECDAPEGATHEPAAVEPGHVSFLGIIFAVGGAVCMGIGAVTTRQAFRSGPPLDSISATLVRVLSGATFLWLAPVVRMQVPQTVLLLRDRHLLTRIGIGTLLGPFIGMFCYVNALKHIPAGLVSTLVAMSPIFAIPVTWLRYRARIGWDVCGAACGAAAGVAMLFWKADG